MVSKRIINEFLRQLWQCGNAKVTTDGAEVYCKASYRLFAHSYSGNLPISRAKRGDPLCLKICQDCAEFEPMGEPLEAEDRGWKNIKVEVN